MPHDDPSPIAAGACEAVGNAALARLACAPGSFMLAVTEHGSVDLRVCVVACACGGGCLEDMH